VLGKTDVAKWATVDTKVVSFSPGSHSASNVEESLETSASLLGPAKVNVMYLHAPDRETPFAETLAAMDKGHKAGKFEKFGLSNFRPDEVEEIVGLCEKNGWIKPCVYQGQYNAVSFIGTANVIRRG